MVCQVDLDSATECFPRFEGTAAYVVRGFVDSTVVPTGSSRLELFDLRSWFVT